MNRFLAMLALAALAMFALPLPAAAQTAPEPPVTVSPAAGPPGTRFAFFGEGFRSRERLIVWLNEPGGRVVPSSVDARNEDRVAPSGRVAFTWTAPADARPGWWSLVARGTRSGTERVFPFQILEPPPPAPPGTGVTPTVGTPGTRYGLFAGGFGVDEALAFYLTPPNGPARLTLPEQLRVANGRADWSWTAPADAARGVWRFTVRGASGAERVIAFEVRDPAATGLGVQPGVGRPGSLFLFFAEGFAERESLALWVNRPDGTIEGIEPERVSVEKGRADWSWVSPDDAPRGQWTMVARGNSSGVERVIVFEIR